MAEAKPASIDDLVEEGMHPRHVREGERIKDVVLDLRIPLLLKHYKNSMSAEDRAKFEAMNEQQQIEKLREKKYMLPKEHADAFVRDMALYIAKKHDEDIGKMLEESFKTYYEDQGADHHVRAKALKRINDFKSMLQGWGFNWPALEEDGAKEGFSRDLFYKHAGHVDAGYIRSWQDAYIDQAKEEEINDYLKKIKGDEELKNFDVDIAMSKKYEDKKKMITNYAQSKKLKDLPGFKDKYHQYFKESK